MFTPNLSFGRLLVALCTAASLGGAEPAWEPLFNGKNLDGWTTWLAKPHASMTVAGESRDVQGAYLQPIGAGRDPLNVFAVQVIDGVPTIRISGQVFGGLTTSREFSNYHLRLQFKWGEAKWAPREKAETKRDSGLLYHVHSDWNFNGKTWPRSPELQIQEHDVGDLYAIGCQMMVTARRLDPTKRFFQYDPANGTPTEFIEQLPIGNRCIRGSDEEKPHGEWNTVELICLGDESIHIVNGKVVMRLSKATRLDGATPATLTGGKLLLQSEGAEIFYRHIELRPITAIPAEYTAK